MGLPGLDILGPEKLQRLEEMAATMERVAEAMERAAMTAQNAADTMLLAATKLEADDG